MVYGCNAIYREEEIANKLSGIIAIDDGIINEIRKSPFASKLIVPPEDERWEPAECNPNRPRSNAGMSAMRYCRQAHPCAGYLFCIGFDFLLTDIAQSTGNIYDGTVNYGPETRCHPADYPNRFRYLEWIMRQYPETLFVFGFPAGREAYSSEASNFMLMSFDKIYEFLDTEQKYVDIYERKKALSTRRS